VAATSAAWRTSVAIREEITYGSANCNGAADGTESGGGCWRFWSSDNYRIRSKLPQVIVPREVAYLHLDEVCSRVVAATFELVKTRGECLQKARWGWCRRPRRAG
jgi:hypothetical protein